VPLVDYPLGCKAEIGDLVPSADRWRLQALQDYDMSFLTEKLITKSEGLITADMVQLAIRELKRFIGLHIIFPKLRLVPSAQIDAAWHQLILFTPAYRILCDRLLGGYFDHIPRIPTDPPSNGGFALTVERYTEAFGPPPSEMWGPVAIRRKRANVLPIACIVTAASVAVLIWSARR
jgi:hypothetical protein